MDTASTALASGDKLLAELAGSTTGPGHAVTMGRLKKLSYSHKAMIDLILENPEKDQNWIAAQFGYSPAWVSNVLASDAFKEQMSLRREEIIDPALKATIRERFEALVIQSLAVLQKKLEQPQVSDNVAIRAAELGAKALGVGGHAPPGKPAETSEDRLERLAGRLRTLRPKEIIDVTPTRVNLQREGSSEPGVPVSDDV